MLRRIIADTIILIEYRELCCAMRCRIKDGDNNNNKCKISYA